jgi:CrcB protein
VTLLLVALGGSAGSMLRYAVDRWVVDAADVRAAGTFAVNVTGSLGIGIFFGLSERLGWPSDVRVLVASGFFGGFTTFSALSWQTLQLLEDGNAVGAGVNVLASVALGLLAVWAGASLGRAVS